jgi:predicted MFS family arabinose efflux permease
MQEILRNRPFISLWWTGVLIQVATWILHTSMLVLVFERTNSPFATGLIPVFASLPLILLGPIAGHIVDRWDRRFVMVCGVLVLAVLMVASIPGAKSGPVSFLFAFIFLQAIVMTVLTPAENALLPLLMPTKHLKLANALNALNDGLGRIIGPAVGSIILVRYGVAGVFGVCLCLFLLAFTLLMTWRISSGMTQSSQESAVDSRHDLGLQALFRGQVVLLREVWVAGGTLLAVITAFALYIVADVPLSAVLPDFVGNSLNQGPEGFGLMLSLRGVAGIAGGVLMVILSRYLSERTMLVAGFLTYGACIALWGFINSYQIGLFILIAVGPAAAAIHTGMTTLLQRATAVHYHGRIFALVGTIGGIITLGASLTAGSVAEVTGSRSVVILSGCLQVLPALVILRQVHRPSGHGASALWSLR